MNSEAGDDHLGERGQIPTHADEQRFELRHDEHQQDPRYDGGDHDDGDRVRTMPS